MESGIHQKTLIVTIRGFLWPVAPEPAGERSDAPDRVTVDDRCIPDHMLFVIASSGSTVAMPMIFPGLSFKKRVSR